MCTSFKAKCESTVSAGYCMRLHFVEARSADLCDSITYKYTFRALLVILRHYSYVLGINWFYAETYAEPFE